MINNKINAMLNIITKMKQSIVDDIEDIKKAKHENLLNRNDEKQELIDALGREKELLNEELVKEVQAGGNIEDYKESIENLETELRDLYSLNHKLASIVLPIKEMYKDIVDEISEQNGGKLIDIKV